MSYRWFFIFFAVVMFFVASMLVAYRSIAVISSNSASISSTLTVVRVIDAIRSNLYAAESGQRGYLLAQDDLYLEPYTSSLTNLNGLIAELSTRDLEAGNRGNQIIELRSLTQAKIAEMDRTIELVRSDRDAAALSIINTDEGARLMSALNALLSDMREREMLLLAESRGAAETTRQVVLATLIITNLIGLSLVLFSYWMNNRHTQRQDALLADIQRVNESLEQQVEERTAALSAYAEELKRSNQELETFAFVASHDLQEPLRKIRAFGDRLQRTAGDQLGEKGTDYIRRMHSASERMSVLIDDLLAFSRVSTKPRDFGPVALQTVLTEVLDDLQYAVEHSDAEICVDNLPTVLGDAVQLGQVFQNLLANSLKFTKSGELPRITISCEIDDSVEPAMARVTLADNGIGFDQQYADRMFNIFQRLHTSQGYKGTGIGLALCRKIIELHGGTIVARGVPNEGATFIMTVPMYETAPPADQESIDEHPESNS